MNLGEVLSVLIFDSVICRKSFSKTFVGEDASISNSSQCSTGPLGGSESVQLGMCLHVGHRPRYSVFLGKAKSSFLLYSA